MPREHPWARRPEQGQRAVGAFLSRLGGGKDRADFDRFMADRAGRSRASA
jgi:hypothetical protein